VALSLSEVRRQLVRLERHHEAVARSYDEVSLLDFCHVLRVWADMKGELATVLPISDATIGFKTATPPSKLKSYVQGVGFVIAYMPGGVTTYAGNGEVMTYVRVRDTSGGWTEGAMSVVAKARLVGGYRRPEQIVLSFRETDDESKPYGPPTIKRCNFANWMSLSSARLPGGVLEDPVVMDSPRVLRLRPVRGAAPRIVRPTVHKWVLCLMAVMNICS